MKRTTVFLLASMLLLTVWDVSCFALSAGAALPSFVPDVLVSSVADRSEYALIVEKQSQRLNLYAFDSTYRRLLQMDCSTGENEGPKNRSGDKKTPEGVYFFIKEHPQRDLAPIYGSRAFPMDYPNLVDRIDHKNGNAIWLHGTNKPLKPRNSNGCIVLANSDIDRLAGYISLNRTPIIVVSELAYTTPEATASLDESIRRFLEEWQRALTQGTYHQYLAFYDDGYLPDISWWPEWSRLRKGFKGADASFSLTLQRLLITRYRQQYVVLFDQTATFSHRRVSAGTRKLFLSPQDDGLRIVGDTYQLRPAKTPGSPSDNPIVAAGFDLQRQHQVAAAEAEDDIQAMIDNWLKAWSSKDISAYGRYYAKHFRSQDGTDLKGWLKYKRRINRRYDFIRVTQHNLSIVKRNNRRVVTFYQDYVSSGFSTKGTKKLILIREEGQWKIYREIWIKN